MSVRKPRYERAEFARRGKDIFERIVRPQLKPENDNWFVAIDIETEEFEMDPSSVNVTNRMNERSPDCQLWLERVGHATAIRMLYRKVVC